MEMLEDELRRAIESFNRRAETDERLRAELEGKTRSVFIELTDAEGYHFTLRESRILDFGRGAVPGPDIHITTDSATLEALMKREMGPMKALVTKRLKLTKISMEDLATIRKFF
ncbi:MAG: SCP2 sterol-binding domain-containing protein [Thermoplasmatota archaeon]